MARVRSGSEARICEEVEQELGLSTYLPQFVRWRKLPKHLAKKQGKNKELVTSILLPCYAFIKVETVQCVTRIKAVRDVFGFISTDAGVCYARDEDIKALMMQEASGINNETEQGRKLRLARDAAKAHDHGAFSLSLQDYTGKMVRLTSGPFEGVTGVVTYHKVKQDKLIVEHSTTGISFTLDADQVELAA